MGLVIAWSILWLGILSSVLTIVLVYFAIMKSINKKWKSLEQFYTGTSAEQPKAQQLAKQLKRMLRTSLTVASLCAFLLLIVVSAYINIILANSSSKPASQPISQNSPTNTPNSTVSATLPTVTTTPSLSVAATASPTNTIPTFPGTITPTSVSATTEASQTIATFCNDLQNGEYPNAYKILNSGVEAWPDFSSRYSGALCEKKYGITQNGNNQYQELILIHNPQRSDYPCSKVSYTLMQLSNNWLITAIAIPVLKSTEC